MLAQPMTHVGVFVRRIVVDDEVDLLAGRSAFFNQAQELNPLLMTVPLMKSIQDLSAAHIHGREQSGRSMAFVMGMALILDISP